MAGIQDTFVERRMRCGVKPSRAPHEGILQVHDGKSGSGALYICEDYGCLRAGKCISHRQQHRRGSANIPGDRQGQTPPLRPPPGPAGAAPRGPTHVPKEYASDNAQDWTLPPLMRTGRWKAEASAKGRGHLVVEIKTPACSTAPGAPEVAESRQTQMDVVQEIHMQ